MRAARGSSEPQRTAGFGPVCCFFWRRLLLHEEVSRASQGALPGEKLKEAGRELFTLERSSQFRKRAVGDRLPDIQVNPAASILTVSNSEGGWLSKARVALPPSRILTTAHQPETGSPEKGTHRRAGEVSLMGVPLSDQEAF